ncbi:MAG: SDR family oxidoreductase [Chloroflexi bacterium]|nr:SDR family oxidoreductase [Chloroflexota bacterium]
MQAAEKNVLITGAAVRIGRAMALAAAKAGFGVIIHYWRSEERARETIADVKALGVNGNLVKADLSKPDEAGALVTEALEYGPLFAVVNSASIFKNQTLTETDLDNWNKHLAVNLTAPFLISQTFAGALDQGQEGRIVNILDWRAIRPGADHFAYTISKAALVSLTHSLAITLAPNITVNGIAFGAILPPSNGADVSSILENVPAGRWADLDEVGRTLLFLLEGPTYITGEIIHLDGGRHLI